MVVFDPTWLLASLLQSGGGDGGESAMSKTGVCVVKTVITPAVFIFKVEEALYRTNKENWCILSQGIAPPKIVMGLGGKPKELVDIQKSLKDDIKVLD